MYYSLTDTYLPVPVKNHRSTYPFKKMIVGQSFFLPTQDHAARARRAAWKYAQRNPGWDYACRKIEDGWRLWRIA